MDLNVVRMSFAKKVFFSGYPHLGAKSDCTLLPFPAQKFSIRSFQLRAIVVFCNTSPLHGSEAFDGFEQA